jgi:hypothetical protein
MLTRLKGFALAASLLIVIALAGANHQGVFAASKSSASYDAFVAKLSANLGVDDPAVVDGAIKASLKQMVDDSLASGAISSKKAATLKTKIDQSEDPGKLLGLDQFAVVKTSGDGNGVANGANGTGAAVDNTDDDSGNAAAGDDGNGAVDDHGSGGHCADDAAGDDHGGSSSGSSDDSSGDDHGGSSHGGSGGDDSGSGSGHGGGKGGHDD